MLKSTVRYNWASRIEKARKMMDKMGIDLLYVTAGPNQFYFSGFSAYNAGWPIWLSALLIPLKGEPAFILTNMHKDIYQYAETWITEIHTYADGENPSGLLKEVVTEKGLINPVIGVEDNMWFGDYTLIQNALPGCRIKSAQRIFDQLRMVKDELEIENIRRANEITVLGYKRAVEIVREGLPEYEAAQAIGQVMLENGAESPIFYGTFRNLSSRKFQKGDIVDVDMGAAFNGYQTDTARNIFIGEPSDEEKRIYELCMECFDRTREMVKPGIQCQEVHRFAKSFLENHGYTLKWKIGHGVGLMAGHEAPLVQEGNDDLVEPGMVFVIDPGVFAPGKHKDSPIHIESLVLVNENGTENLTKFPHDMIVV